MIYEAIVKGTGNDLFISNDRDCDYSEAETIQDWIAFAEGNGYTVTENLELDGKIREQGAGQVFTCTMDNDPANAINVVVFEN